MIWSVWAGPVPGPVEWGTAGGAVFWVVAAVAAVPAAVAVWRAWANTWARARVGGFRIGRTRIACERPAA